jgi:hypothetical protein
MSTPFWVPKALAHIQFKSETFNMSSLTYEVLMKLRRHQGKGKGKGLYGKGTPMLSSSNHTRPHALAHSTRLCPRVVCGVQF